MRIMFLSQSPLDERAAKAHDRVQTLLRSYTSPGTELDLCYPDDFPGAQVFRAIGAKNQLNGLQHAVETPALIRKTVWAEQEGYDAVVQSNTFDPAIEPSRLAVRIPVVGLLRTAVHIASTLAGRLGVLVPLAGHVPHTWRILNGYGMAGHVTAIRSIGVYGDDIVSRREEIKRTAIDQIQELIDQTQIEYLIPLGGALIPYVVDPIELEREVGVPVINTKAVGIRQAEMLVDLGMSHSKLAYVPSPVTLAELDAFATR